MKWKARQNALNVTYFDPIVLVLGFHCFAYGSTWPTLPFHAVLLTNVLNERACQLECVQASECEFFLFHLVEKECTLLPNGDVNEEDRINSKYHGTGPKSC